MTFIPTPFPTPVVSPAATAGSAYRAISYLSISEYQYAPTAVSTNAIVQGGSAADQQASLAQVIARASAKADEFCFHRGDGTLAASITTESDWYKVKPDGSIAIICNFKPILAVVGVGLGPLPANQSNLDAPTGQNITWKDTVITLPGTWQWSGPSPFFGGYPSYNSQVYVTWQYVNGWPLMSLADTANQGTSSLTVNPAVPGQLPPPGVYANTALTIKDGVNTETVVVSTTPTSSTLALVSPLRFTHTPPPAPDAILVTAIPDGIEQAVISLTSMLLKTQGTRAMVLPKIGSPAARQAAGRAGALEDMDLACHLLKPFQVVYQDH